jgi:3-ketosteroid 9alpha-monooxygenase subunit A
MWCVERGTTMRELLERSELSVFAKPSGWFQAGWSHEYKPGAVKPLRYFGRDLVGYRTATGVFVLADAHCPHFGAHLGHGGVVDGECIQCPFHGWTWDAHGRNASIPYSNRTHKGKQLRHHIVRERDGIIYFWHDESGSEPTWEPPTT